MGGFRGFQFPFVIITTRANTARGSFVMRARAIFATFGDIAGENELPVKAGWIIKPFSTAVLANASPPVKAPLGAFVSYYLSNIALASLSPPRCFRVSAFWYQHFALLSSLVGYSAGMLVNYLARNIISLRAE